MEGSRTELANAGTVDAGEGIRRGLIMV